MFIIFTLMDQDTGPSSNMSEGPQLTCDATGLLTLVVQRWQ